MVPSPPNVCPYKNKKPCPLTPKKPGKCVKSKCKLNKPGFASVAVRNCFGRKINKVLASYTNKRGVEVCNKER